MTEKTRIKLSIAGILLIIMITPTWLTSRMIINVKTEAKCLENGYSEYAVDYQYNGYCINTFNEFTEIVSVIKVGKK